MVLADPALRWIRGNRDLRIFRSRRRARNSPDHSTLPHGDATGVIHLEGVETRYEPDEPRVLSGFDLLVQQGEAVALLGPSGVGKTTALRTIAGFERVLGGYVRIGGRLVASPFIHVPPEERNLGLVFQSYALFPHLTVEENISFGIRGKSGSVKPGHVGEVMEMCGLTELRSRAVQELSGGQQQRVAIARAIAPDNVAILMDEPFSNLDPGLVNRLRRQVRRIIQESNMTAILVTHDRETAFLTSDRIAVMHEGKVAQVGTAEEIYARPKTRHVARTIGHGAFIRGNWRAGLVFTEAGSFPATSANGVAPRDGEEVLALMRASELRLRAHDTPGASEDGYFPSLASAVPCGEDCRCAARIASREFHGDFTNFEVMLPSGARLRVRRRSHISSPPDGSAVTIETVPGASVIVYPAD